VGGDKSFEEAIEQNDLARVKYLLTKRFFLFRRVDPNDWRRSNDGPPIFDAASRGHLEIVRELIAAGVRLNDGHAGYNALHVAASRGHLEVVCLLSHYGALSNLDRDGSTPLDYAQEAGHQEVVAFLQKDRQQ